MVSPSPLFYQHFFEAACMVPFCMVPAAAAHNHVAKPELFSTAPATFTASGCSYSVADVSFPLVNSTRVSHRLQASVLSSGVTVKPVCFRIAIA